MFKIYRSKEYDYMNVYIHWIFSDSLDAKTFLSSKSFSYLKIIELNMQNADLKSQNALRKMFTVFLTSQIKRRLSCLRELMTLSSCNKLCRVWNCRRSYKLLDDVRNHTIFLYIYVFIYYIYNSLWSFGTGCGTFSDYMN